MYEQSILPDSTQKPKGSIWFTNIPVGHSTLNKTVKRLHCIYIHTSAGISGHKTNHSLRVTSAICLFQSGADEQFIMSRTGHRSIEGGIRAQKRICTEQTQGLSRVLNSATNRTSYTANCVAQSLSLHALLGLTLYTNSMMDGSLTQADVDVHISNIDNKCILCYVYVHVTFLSFLTLT